MFKLIESRPEREPRIVEIPESDLPVTIGKSESASYQVGAGADPRSVYFRCLSRVQATLYKDGDDYLVKDGGIKPSANGIFLDGRRHANPIRLYPGLQVELFPSAGGYHLTLVWAAAKPGPSEFETAIMERDDLREELTVADEKIEELTWVVSEVNTRLDQTNNVAANLATRVNRLTAEIKKLQDVNRRQDSRFMSLKRVMIGAGVSTFAATWLLLGGNTETLEMIGKLVVAVTSFISLVAGAKSGG